jgi:lipopolysaccharide transport system ATP-binding protein
MGDDVAIRAEGLGKSYRIDHKAGASYRTLRESLASLAARGLRRTSGSSHETIWALRDVSFEVQRGAALGIIGRNGAGKSTLLKILSRITRPTIGRAEVYGRIGSLLEVGTGFHPELTGRENIYLNGAILGMSRGEIRRRFDEIVEFAETERFLDTPVKRYSTGMYMRLAFAVAAHLETDILVVDEVLAVGDAAFQAKSLGKMGDVSRSGRTVLFVSHNLAAVTQLCGTALLLDHGYVIGQGPAAAVVGQYLSTGNREGQIDLDAIRSRPNAAPVRFTFAELLDSKGQVCQDFPMGSDVLIRFRLRFETLDTPTRLALSIRASDGLPMTLTADVDAGFVAPTGRRDPEITVCIPEIRFFPGEYRVTLWASDAANVHVYDSAEDCLTFRIPDGGTLTFRRLPREWGVVFLSPTWSAS